MAELTFAEISKLLKYEPETGKLFWLPRPVEMFSDGGHPAKWNCDKWNAKHSGREAFYTIDGKGYRCGAINGKRYLAHRVIWLLAHAEWPKLHIDHINGVRTDNRIQNLRDVSNAENHRNTRLQKSNKSGVSGVSQISKTKKWRARIVSGGAKIHLGHFDTFEEAVLAKKDAEERYGYHPNHGRN